jgi:hypothetical protein
MVNYLLEEALLKEILRLVIGLQDTMALLLPTKQLSLEVEV